VLGGVFLCDRGGGTLIAQQQPSFRSSVEVTSIDVTVVDGNSQPVTDLKPADFTVKVGGSERRVVSAEWVSLTTASKTPPPPPPQGYSTNENMTGGRLIVLAIDQPNIRFGDNAPLLKTVDAFLEHLEPSDRVSAVSFGSATASTSFTSDRELVKRAVAAMAGEGHSPETGQFQISLSEAIGVSRNDTAAIYRLHTRECDDRYPTGDERRACYIQVDSEAQALVQYTRANATDTLASLRRLLEALQTIDAPKTVVIVSQGFAPVDQDLDILDVGSLSAAARASLYVLALDQPPGDITSTRPVPVRAEDRQLQNAGLDLLVSASRGALFRVFGNGSTQFAQITSELSGYYLLGVESNATDKDGKPHSIDVAVGRRGLTVRSRRQLKELAGTRARAPRDAVVAALTSPLSFSAMPLRLATFALRQPESNRMQVLIHAEIGTDYASTQPVSLAYTIYDQRGKLVDSQVVDARLSPVMRGVPSALQLVTSVTLDPGEYMLKFGAADTDRVGTVEHQIHATLTTDGPIALSELMVGGATSTANPLRPSVGYDVAFGLLQAYLEAYGPADRLPSVKYEIASTPDGPTLLSADAHAISGGRERAIFTEMLPVRQLPSGKYVLRAIVTPAATAADDSRVATLTRPFEVAAPAVLMTSATVPSVTTAPGEIYLPVPEALFARKFSKDDLVKGDTLRTFRDSVSTDVRAAFDNGVSALASGRYPQAEQSFKSAIKPDTNVTAPMAYLAAVYAVTGNDEPAAGAWRTALIDGSDFPQIYEWLADTLIRSHQLAEARTVLEEALTKWPSDIRFAKPMAIVYATFGQGREAVRTLDRYLSSRGNDVQALSLGVEWMFRLHTAGGAARTPVDDLKLARTWADAYTKAKGPQSALVKEWMDALERSQQ
jgi:VWFA-related protein